MNTGEILLKIYIPIYPLYKHSLLSEAHPSNISLKLKIIKLELIIFHCRFIMQVD